MPVLYTQFFPAISGCIQLPDKAVIAGRNGRGKSTILNAVRAAIVKDGRLLGGAKLKDIHPDASARLEECTATEVFDLSIYSTMTGAARAEALYRLLGAEVTKAEIEGVIYQLFRPSIRKEADTIVGDADIDKCIARANKRKNDLDDELRALRNIATPPDMDKAVAKLELEKLEKRLASCDDSKRKSLEKEYADIMARLGGYADRPVSDIAGKMPTIKGNITDLQDKRTIVEDKLAALTADARSLNTSVRSLREVQSPQCPTCGQAVNDALIAKIAEAAQAATKLRDDVDKVLRELVASIDKWKANLAKGEGLIKDMNRRDELKQQIAALPVSRYSAAEIEELQDRKKEFEGVLLTYANAELASARIPELEYTASAVRKAEMQLKKLKGDCAQRAGFPESVQGIVKATLGWELTFGKAERTMDILVKDGKQTRGISTCSAGEWQIIAAAFGAMKHDAAILVEAAEIDSENYGKLQKALSAHKGLVYIADCHGRNPENWKVIE